MKAASPAFSRASTADVRSIRVVRAVSAADRAAVAAVRASGFSRSLRRQDSKVIRWVDVADRDGSAFTLIAFNAQGRPTGTVRLQDSRLGALELGRYVDLRRVLDPARYPVVQVSRLTVARGPRAAAVMLALFRAAWTWCVAEGVPTMVVATPRRMKPLYEYMQFEDIGDAGWFRHAFAGPLPQVTMRLDVLECAPRMRAGRHPLGNDFLEVAEHLGLNN